MVRPKNVGKAGSQDSEGEEETLVELEINRFATTNIYFSQHYNQ